MVYNWWDKCFKSRKIFKAYFRFRILYVFPFTSAGHWPIDSGRDKVGIRAMVSLLIFEPSLYVFIHYCGIRLSNVSFVIIASSIMSVCYCVWFYLVCLLWMRSRARDAPAIEAVDKVDAVLLGWSSCFYSSTKRKK